MSLGDLLLIVWIFSLHFYVSSIESNKTSTLVRLPKLAGVVYLGFYAQKSITATVGREYNQAG